VSDRPDEFLVLLGDERGVEALTESLRVTQVASPRLAIVEAPEAVLRSIQAVTAVAGPGRALEGGAELTPQERLFADAWSQRTRGQRAGEGLAWDAPGFAPPDPPERE
jgi:hypothetical protein